MAGLVMAGFSLTSLTGCMEVTEPASNIATEEQIQNSPSSSESFLMAMPAYFNKVNTAWVQDQLHFPFGYGAIMYIRDLMTGDLLQSSKNYTVHFYYWAQNKYQGDGYLFGQYISTYYYNFILTINNMVGAVNPENATDQQLGYLGATSPVCTSSCLTTEPAISMLKVMT